MMLGRMVLAVPAVVLFVLIDGAVGNDIDTSLRPTPGHNATNPVDRLALHGLFTLWASQYTHVTGTNWGIPHRRYGKKRPDWDLSVDPCGSASCSTSTQGQQRCNWEGLTCEGYRVHAIELPGRALQGTSFVTHICHLQELRRLDLSRNRFRGRPPLRGCRAMPNLAAIDISNNLFEGEVPLGDTLLPSLVLLIISRNSFNGFLPDSWGSKMGALEVLDLGYNNMKGPIPEILATLESLRLLVLDYNCGLCGQLSNRLSDQVTVSLKGTNTGSGTCSFEDCQQSTPLFVGKIAVTVTSICFLFFGVCCAMRSLARRRQQRSNVPTAEEQNADVKKPITPGVELRECVGLLVVMPDGGNHVYVALPVSQKLPLSGDLGKLPSSAMAQDVTTSSGDSEQQNAGAAMKPITPGVELPKCVSTVVLMPGGDNHVFVALPVPVQVNYAAEMMVLLALLSSGLAGL
eukprot:jgi/Tetstr1/461762/TSEL_006851.t1